MPSRILAAATRLFASRGVDATSVQAVADEVGIRKQSLLHHFPSKAELRQAVLAGLVSRWNQVLPSILAATTDPRNRIDAILGAVMGFFLEDPDRARILLREVLDRPEEMQDRLRSSSATWMKLIAEAIRAGQQAGRVRPEVDPEAFVLNLVHTMIAGVGCLEATRVLLGDGPVEEAARRLLTELIREARAGLFLEVSRAAA